MAERQVFISNAIKLSLKNNSLLVLNKEEKEIAIPIEDCSFILLEDPTTIISAKLIAHLADKNVALIICNDEYIPVSISLPYCNHYKQLKVFQWQLEVKKPVLSQIWEKIIIAKINNQKIVLKINKASEDKIQYLEALCKDVKSNDNTNREAIAAKVFFKSSYGDNYNRNTIGYDEINSAQNYGYTVLASQMARTLSAYGCNTAIGIFHHNYLNNFNLAYDLVEPFRSIVDNYIIQASSNIYMPLSKSVRKDLINLLNSPIKIGKINYKVQHAMEEMVLSFIKCLQENDSQYLLIPTIIDRVENE